MTIGQNWDNVKIIIGINYIKLNIFPHGSTVWINYEVLRSGVVHYRETMKYLEKSSIGPFRVSSRRDTTIN